MPQPVDAVATIEPLVWAARALGLLVTRVSRSRPSKTSRSPRPQLRPNLSSLLLWALVTSASSACYGVNVYHYGKRFLRWDSLVRIMMNTILGSQTLLMAAMFVCALVGRGKDTALVDALYTLCARLPREYLDPIFSRGRKAQVLHLMVSLLLACGTAVLLGIRGVKGPDWLRSIRAFNIICTLMTVAVVSSLFTAQARMLQAVLATANFRLVALLPSPSDSHPEYKFFYVDDGAKNPRASSSQNLLSAHKPDASLIRVTDGNMPMNARNEYRSKHHFDKHFSRKVQTSRMSSLLRFDLEAAGPMAREFKSLKKLSTIEDFNENAYDTFKNKETSTSKMSILPRNLRGIVHRKTRKSESRLNVMENMCISHSHTSEATTARTLLHESQNQEDIYSKLATETIVDEETSSGPDDHKGNKMATEVRHVAQLLADVRATAGALEAAFSVRLLFMLIHSYFPVTYSTFNLARILLDPTALSSRTVPIIYLMLFFMLFYIGHVVFVLHACERITEEANKSAVLVHNLLLGTDDPGVRHELQLLSLQLLHRRVQFSACGFFPFDFSLLYSIVGAVTTYLVILIQIQLSLGSNKQK